MSGLTRRLLAFGNAAVLAAISTVAWRKDSVSRTATAAGTAAKSATPPVVRALFTAGDTSMVAAVEKSTLIFGAMVLSRDTAIGPHASASPPRMRVRIDSTLRKPPAMDNLTGDTATILAGDSAGVAPGGRAVFFTYGLLAGTTLVVQEVKHVVIQSDSALNIVRAQLAVADSQLTDRKIVDASNGADAVLLDANRLDCEDQRACFGGPPRQRAHAELANRRWDGRQSISRAGHRPVAPDATDVVRRRGNQNSRGTRRSWRPGYPAFFGFTGCRDCRPRSAPASIRPAGISCCKPTTRVAPPTVAASYRLSRPRGAADAVAVPPAPHRAEASHETAFDRALWRACNSPRTRPSGPPRGPAWATVHWWST